MVPADLAGDPLRDPGEGVIDRVSLVAVVESGPVGTGDEDEALVGTHGLVHRLDRHGFGTPPLVGRVEDLAQCPANGANVGEGLVAGRAASRNPCECGVPLAGVDQAVIPEPFDRIGGLLEVIDGFAVFELERIDELEGVVDVDVV